MKLQRRMLSLVAGHRAALLGVALVMGALVPLTPTPPAAAAGETTDLVFLVDGSGSISATDWQIQKDGLSAALQDAAVFPRDLSMAVAVVQWSFVSSTVITRDEVPLTVLDSQPTVDAVVAQIQAMQQLGASTNPGDAIRRGTDLLLAGGENPTTSKWTLCMSTDGTTNSGESLGTAVGYAAANGVDRYSVIGIEDPPFETAASLRNHYSPHVFGGGSVTIARNAIEFASLIKGSCLGDPVELRALEVNQSVQDWHNSVPLVTDKPTTVRAFVQMPAGDDDQRVVGRLIGRRGGSDLPGSPLLALNTGSEVLATQDIVSRRATLDDSLNFSLPTSWRSGTIELELEAAGAPVNCMEPVGADPADNCVVTVTFRDEVTPEIVFVGVRYANGATTFEPTLQELFEQAFRFRSILPVADLDYRLDTMGNYTSTPALTTVNSDLATKRFMDAFACIFGCADPTSFNSRYYGVLSGDGGGLANDIPGTVSSGFLSGTGARGDTGYARNRGPHELSHNLGRHHAVDNSLPLNGDGNKVGRCGEAASPSAPGHTPFETVGGSVRPVLGPLTSGADEEMWGLDNRFLFSNTNDLAVVDPRQTFELMSYCGGGPQARWISEFTYNGLMGSFPAAAAVGASAGNGNDFVLVSGTVDFGADTATMSPTLELTGQPPAPTPGDYRLQLLDSGGSELAAADFEPTVMDADAPAPGTATGPPTGLFLVPLPKPATPIAEIAVLHNGARIGGVTASANAPSESIVSPAGGESFTSDTVTFEWTTADADGDSPTSTVLYSDDDGNTWDTLTVHTSATSLTVQRSDLHASATARLQVIASDGVHSSSAISNQFAVAGNAPEVTIDSPASGDLFTGLQDVPLAATAVDPEDGPLTGASLAWSSDRDGALGTGEDLMVNASNLSEGTHVLTVTATDADGASASASVTIEILRIAPPPPPETAPTMTAVSSSANPSTFGQPVTFTATVSSAESGTPTGTVTFDDGGVPLGSAPLAGGTASVTTSSLTVGSHAVTASYGGDADFDASASAVLVQVVGRARTTIVAEPLINLGRLFSGRLGELRATLTRSSAPAGPVAGATVHFLVGGRMACQAITDAAGIATCPAGLGNVVGALLTGGYTARFDGDAGALPASARGAAIGFR